MNTNRLLMVLITCVLLATALFSQGNGTNSNPLSIMRVTTFSNGAIAATPALCDKQVSLSTSTSGLLQIIALSAGKIIRVCHISFATTAPEDFQLTYGTGSNCATGGTPVTGLYKSVQSFDFNFPLGSPLTTAVVSQELCINQSASQAAGITIIYGQN